MKSLNSFAGPPPKSAREGPDSAKFPVKFPASRETEKAPDAVSMKPAPFDYARPSDVDQACAMLAAGDDARIIAGGQTLVPLMAMRLARPKRLIDIARISDLAFVRHERDGVAIGATTRQCVLERDAVVRTAVPLLAKVM